MWGVQVAEVTRPSQPALWRIEGCPCRKGKHRCGSRTGCLLLPLYQRHAALIARTSSKKDADIPDLELKKLNFLAISVDPSLCLAKDRGGTLIETFPFRVDPGKQVEWLNLISEVGVEHAHLGCSGTEERDCLLDWIREQMDDDTARFHARLKECLISHAGGPA